MTKLYFEGVSYSADALNDEESAGTDVTTTELNLDQFYQGTISSQLTDSTDIDLYSFEVVEGQTYSLAYSSHGNVIGWNAQTPDPAQIYNSDFNLTFSVKTTDDQEIDLQYEFNTRRTTDSSDYTSANFYSFTAEKTETLYLEVAPRTTGTSSYYADKKQDYGFLIQNLSGNGLHNTTDNKLLGSIFDDELTITAIENAALDYSYQKYFLSGNDNITVDAQGIYNWNLGSDYHLGEGNDFIEIINEAYVRNNTYQHIALHADGGVGDDVLRGGAGNDTLTGGNGADQLTGGAGDDTLKGDCDNRDLWWCHYESIEKIGANDIIDAGAGDDTIIGGAGADTVTGGTGKDTFIFEVSEDFGDTITDFNVDEDYIVLFQPINQQNLTDKAFDDFVRVTQSGNDAVVQLDLSGNASQWTTVATLENLDAQTVSKDNFVSLNKLKTNEDNHTLYFEGVSYSADALNDEESAGTDVTTTELNLDQFYQGTISSQLSDSTDIDLYSFEVVEGQTYSLAYSSHGNVIGWNAQTPDPAQIYNSDFNLTFSVKTTDDQEIDLQYEFDTRRTTDSSDYTSANFYSFTAEKTETLYLEVAPRTTGTSSYYADKKQDYGFLIQNLSGNGLHNTTDNKLLGSIFDDELTITAIENAALDYSYQKYFLSGNDNITVDAQGIYNWNLGSDYHLGEGNDFIEIINEAYVRNNTYEHIALRADGGVGDDVLRGGAGNDTLAGGNGADQLTGGAGDDTLKGDCDNRDLWWCHYESIEKIGANDIIDAGAGDDTIIGGAGADTVTGGTGKDTFIFEVTEDFGDTITDFNVDEDYIVLFQPINQQNLTDKAFDDFVRVTQSGNDAVVQLDLSGNASQWTTVATLENLDAQTVSKDNFVSLNKLKTNEDNHTLYFEGVSYSADALNDEESAGTDVTTTELNLDQFYQGTISSQLSDSTDIDLYSFEVVEGQTYSLAYSSHGNVIGWNAQTPDPAQIYNSDFNLTFSVKTTDDQEIDLQYEFNTRRTTDSSDYTSANFYSFTAEKTETLYLEVAPRTTGTSSYYADKKQDYGFLIQNLSGNGLHNTTDNKLLGSIFDDELTITAIENAALDYSYQKYFLSGNDNITVDAQGIYNWNLGSDYHLGEGNDFIEIINEAYVRNNTYQHIALHADGGVGDDVLRGGAGNDTLTGGNGADQLTGGAGDDTLKGDCDNRDLWWCHYESIEKIGANDIIDAGAGDDTIIGGAGADTVTGGTGKDTFIFEVSEDFGDTITDFNVDEDYIVLFQPINQQNLTDKAFDDFVRVTQSGNDAVVQLDLSGNASQWTTVATLENLDAQTVSKDNFVSLNKLKTNDTNVSNSLASGEALIVGNLQAGETLTAITSSIQDDDGLGTFSYQWKANGNVISGANSVSYTLTDDEVGQKISVVVSFYDGSDNFEEVISNQTAAITKENITSPNNQPTGNVSILGTPWVGESLYADTSSLEDADGLGTLSYQWFANDEIILGANEKSYILTETELGKKITVSVKYVDGTENNETLNSIATKFVSKIDLSSIVQMTEFQVAAYTSPQQKFATISLDNGGFAIAWIAVDENGLKGCINLQLYDVFGQNLLAVQEIPLKQLWTNLSLSDAGDGNVIVSWQDYNEAYSGRLINIQKFSSSINLENEPVQVNNLDGGIDDPFVTRLTDGKFVVIWMKLQDGFGDVYARLLDADGNPTGTEFKVNTYDQSDQWRPKATALSDGSFVITWQSRTWDSIYTDQDAHGIFGQRFSTNGDKIGIEFQLNTITEGDQSDPSIISLRDGGFFAVWDGVGENSKGFYTSNIYGGLFDKEGNKVGNDILINTNIDENTDKPTITTLNDGSVVVAWSATSVDGAKSEIKLKRYSNNFTADGEEILIHQSTESSVYSPSIIGLQDGGYLVTWRDSGVTNSEGGIYSTRYDSSNQVVGSNTNVSNSLASGEALIVGKLQAGETLAAITSSIQDDNGLGTFSYQWKADGNVISGANSVSYTLTDDEVGQKISVVVSFYDSSGNFEEVISNQTTEILERVETSTVSTYEWVQDRKSYADAVAYAESKGGYLASVTSKEELDIIYSLVSENFTGSSYLTLGYASDGGEAVYVWLGASDALQEGTWVWESGETFDYNAWGAGNGTVEPDNYNDQDALGLALEAWPWTATSSNAIGNPGEWNDIDVSNLLTFVIEYEQAANSTPTGAVTIEGNYSSGQTLTAITSSIQDDDGLGTFSYQWKANGNVISGANSVSYTLTDDQVGQKISVVVSFYDGSGNFEEVISNQTTEILERVETSTVSTYEWVQDRKSYADAVAYAESKGGYLASVTSKEELDIIYSLVSENFTGSSYLTLGYASDGGEAVYVWLGASDALQEGTWVWESGETFDYNAWGAGNGTVEPDNYNDQDALGLALEAWPWTATSSNAIGNPGEWNDIDVSNLLTFVIEYEQAANSTPTGAVTIEGNYSSGQTLTAITSSIQDDDGLGTFNYQWKANGNVISGANSVSYTLTDDQVGQKISVVMSFYDGSGKFEEVVSNQTAAITNAQQYSTNLSEIFRGQKGEDIFNFIKKTDDSLGHDIIQEFSNEDDILIFAGYDPSKITTTLDSSGYDHFIFDEDNGESSVRIENDTVASSLKLNNLSGKTLKIDSSDYTVDQGGVFDVSATTSVSTVSIDGATSFKTSLKKASDNTASDPINLSDVLAQLKHIIGLKELKANALQAGDVNDDHTVNLSDVLMNLKHIIGLKEIDTFDLVTDNGFAINSLNSDSNGYLTLVINGDADQSHADWDLS